MCAFHKDIHSHTKQNIYLQGNLLRKLETTCENSDGNTN